MRIGILTFHRAHNYGAVLQCYALQQYLLHQGHDVYIIDYNRKELWCGYEWRMKIYENQVVKQNILKFPVRLFKYLWYNKKIILRYYKFKYFQERKLRLADVKTIFSHPYDLILIGSDQVWNTEITQGVDSYYWGTFKRPTSTKVATYAASMRKEWHKKDLEVIYKNLKKLDGISVREKNLIGYVNVLFPDLNPTYVPDPVLLLTSSQWEKIAKHPKIKGDYIFLYQAENTDRVYNVAKKLSQREGMPLIVLSANVRADNTKECHASSPQEFLGWILNAKIVVTSSFHALAFSILFQKDFYAMNLKAGKDERLNNLLSYFQLENHLIDDIEQCIKLPSFDSSALREELEMVACEYLARL